MIPLAGLFVVLVTGLSGAGKNSILRALEDLGFETMDNPPLTSLESLASRPERNIAIGVDARSRGFDAALILKTLALLRGKPGLRPELIYATADDESLLRRYTESRRRHPLSQTGTVAEGIALERSLTEDLRSTADFLIDTSALTLPALRSRIEQRYGRDSPSLALALISFGYPNGLPREADLVFDARFLKNPYYDEELRALTGQDVEIGTFITADPHFTPYFAHITGMIDFLLPRFVQEGKKYATIAIGCTGGQHRSVFLIESLAAYLLHKAWNVSVIHRELSKNEPAPMGRPEQITGTTRSR